MSNHSVAPWSMYNCDVGNMLVLLDPQSDYAMHLSLLGLVLATTAAAEPRQAA